MKYSIEQINQINNSISIVEYASQYLKLEQGVGKRNVEYWCICPLHSGDINPSMSFNSEKNVFKCMGCNSKGGLINFVQQYHNLSFPKAIEHLIKYSNLTFIRKEPSNILEFLYKSNSKPNDKEIAVRNFLPENIMKQYTKAPIVEWINEGISQTTLEKYQVRYDNHGNRIIFPINDIVGNIIAIKGRTRYENYKDLGIVKYIYYQPIGTNDFLFGLDKNITEINKTNKCIIVESEKSVMKLDTWNIKNAVAIGTSYLNDQQIKLLLSLQCDLIFAFDKDIDKKRIFKEIKKLSLFTNVYYIFDENGLLSNKDSPVDQGIEIWERLYKERYLIEK